jgi:hypothetical protein
LSGFVGLFAWPVNRLLRSCTRRPIVSARKTGDVVPVKPDQKREKPDNERGADKEKKFPEPASFSSSFLSHVGLIVASELT